MSEAQRESEGDPAKKCGTDRDDPFNAGTAELEQSLQQLEEEGILCTKSMAAAQRMSRRDEDAVLLRRLTARGLAGLEYDAWINELASYGLGVFTAWTLNSMAYSRAYKIGRPVASNDRLDRPTRDEAEGLANLAVTYGLKLFRTKALERGGWTPEGGASLKTFFIGACLLKFSTACRDFKPDRAPCPALSPDVVDQIPSQRIGTDPAIAVVIRTHIECLMSTATPMIRRIMKLMAEGYTHQEIADQLGNGATARSVEGAIRRARRAFKRHELGGE